MNSTVRPLKGQTICAANVRLREGKHGLVEEEEQGETKAQVKDVPAPSYHPIILPKKRKKSTEATNNMFGTSLCLAEICKR